MHFVHYLKTLNDVKLTLHNVAIPSSLEILERALNTFLYPLCSLGGNLKKNYIENEVDGATTGTKLYYLLEQYYKK